MSFRSPYEPQDGDFGKFIEESLKNSAHNAEIKKKLAEQQLNSIGSQRLESANQSFNKIRAQHQKTMNAIRHDMEQELQNTMSGSCAHDPKVKRTMAESSEPYQAKWQGKRTSQAQHQSVDYQRLNTKQNTSFERTSFNKNSSSASTTPNYANSYSNYQNNQPNNVKKDPLSPIFKALTICFVFAMFVLIYFFSVDSNIDIYSYFFFVVYFAVFIFIFLMNMHKKKKK